MAASDALNPIQWAPVSRETKNSMAANHRRLMGHARTQREAGNTAGAIAWTKQAAWQRRSMMAIPTKD